MVKRKSVAPRERRCVAPIGDVPDDAPLESIQLCGEPATTERESEGVLCPLCAAHAAELDAERAEGRE